MTCPALLHLVFFVIRSLPVLVLPLLGGSLLQLLSDLLLDVDVDPGEPATGMAGES